MLTFHGGQEVRNGPEQNKIVNGPFEIKLTRGVLSCGTRSRRSGCFCSSHLCIDSVDVLFEWTEKVGI